MVLLLKDLHLLWFIEKRKYYYYENYEKPTTKKRLRLKKPVLVERRINFYPPYCWIVRIRDANGKRYLIRYFNGLEVYSEKAIRWLYNGLLFWLIAEKMARTLRDVITEAMAHYEAIIKKEGNLHYFVSEEGLPCIMTRVWRLMPENQHSLKLFNWTGYVGIPKGHPLYGRDYNKLYDDDIDIRIHGGLTYSDRRAYELLYFFGGLKWSEPFRKFLMKYKDWYFFGFDCGHAWDVDGPLAIILPRPNAEYRDKNYVIDELKLLSKQLKKLASSVPKKS